MGGFNRDHVNGQTVTQRFLSSWSKDKYSEAYHQNANRILYNDVGGGAILLGPYQGNIPRCIAGGLVIGAESNPENNLGQRSSGYGRRWERLHLIGVSAGHLEQRDYSNYNTVMGTHGLNSAMIPFEGIVNWVIAEKRKYIYSVHLVTKVLELEKVVDSKHIEWTRGNVAQSITQSISYTSSNDNSIWINLAQKHVCQIVSSFASGERIAHDSGIPDNWRLSTANENTIYAEIARLNALIIDTQNKHTNLNDQWSKQNGIPKVM